MIMSDQIIKEQLKTSDIKVNISYNTGVRINIGVPARDYSPIDQFIAVNNDKINEARHTNLVAEKSLATTNTLDPSTKTPTSATDRMMTKQEFEDMVTRILEKIHSQENIRAALYSKDEMTILLNALNHQNNKTQQTTAQEPSRRDEKDLLIKQLSERINKLENALSRRESSVVNNIIGQPSTSTTSTNTLSASDATLRANKNELPPAFKLNRIALLMGPNFGEATQLMVGARGYLQISNSNLDFVPEIMAGFGKQSGFAISGSVVYNYNIGSLTPYTGVGLGLFKHGNKTQLKPTFLIGTSYGLFESSELFADYSIRGFFNNNMLSIGYRFLF